MGNILTFQITIFTLGALGFLSRRIGLVSEKGQSSFNNLVIYMILPVSDIARGLSVILAAMPAGATTGILAEKYNAEPAFATKLVVLSTLLSIPTIAVWMLILE